MSTFAFMRTCNPVWDVQKAQDVRRCLACRESKPIDNFYLKGVASSGPPARFHRCKTCMVAKQIARNKKRHSAKPGVMQ